MLDEVAVGEGRVVPSSKEQIVQSLDGGIVSELLVKEGDGVEKGQLLAVLDPVTANAIAGESMAKLTSLRAKSARITAEIGNRNSIEFPADIAIEEHVRQREEALFVANRQSIREALVNLKKMLKITKSQVSMIAPLVESGAANNMELSEAQQKVADLESKISDLRNSYYSNLKKEFADTMAEIEPLERLLSAKTAQLGRTEIRSPTKATVKEIKVTTQGGVVSPGGVLMELTPVEDEMLVEARVSPRDIAFIHPGLKATIKFSAYDYMIYGSMKGEVWRISPDTVESEVQRGQFYYRAYIRTHESVLRSFDGAAHPIIVGMMATTEINTGRKSLFDFLVKPLNRAAEALRER